MALNRGDTVGVYEIVSRLARAEWVRSIAPATHG
jgi:hypothetical protein